MEIFRARYEVEDGYAGPSRPQSFDIGSDDIEPEMDGAELEALFDYFMQENFSQDIVPYAVNRDQFVEWAEKIQAEGE